MLLHEAAFNYPCEHSALRSGFVALHAAMLFHDLCRLPAGPDPGDGSVAAGLACAARMQRATALEALERWEPAMADLLAVFALDPGHKQVHRIIHQATSVRRQYACKQLSQQ